MSFQAIRITRGIFEFVLIVIAVCIFEPSCFAQDSGAVDNESWTPFKLSLIPGKWEFPKNKSVKGLRFGIASTSQDRIDGIDCGLYLEAAKVNGIQVSFIGSASNLNGVSLGGFNIANRVDGIQANLIGNWVLDSTRGAQLGAMNVASEVRGAQIGVWNMGDVRVGAQLGLVNMDFTHSDSQLNPSDNKDQQISEPHLFQVGIINYARVESKGFQIGVINLAQSLHGIQLGIINYIRVHKTLPFSFLPILNFSF